MSHLFQNRHGVQRRPRGAGAAGADGVGGVRAGARRRAAGLRAGRGGHALTRGRAGGGGRASHVRSYNLCDGMAIGRQRGC